MTNAHQVHTALVPIKAATRGLKFGEVNTQPTYPYNKESLFLTIVSAFQRLYSSCLLRLAIANTAERMCPARLNALAAAKPHIKVTTP